MSATSVKQERHDEAEIQELAAKMVEANNAKMSTIQNSMNRTQNSTGGNLLNFITRTNSNGKAVPTPAAPAASTTNNTPSSDASKATLDERSQEGQFGWSMLGKDHIPYIYRGEDKYCAVRMVESKVLNKYLSLLHQDIYNCTCIRSYYITENESRLLNEVNFIHCDSQFGRDQFSCRDLIVRLSDTSEFYKFLDACYSKLLYGSTYPLERCGFVRINKESVVPYTLYNEQKYVPLFYFEGETDNLKCKALNLDGWDLSYLKFCYKVQGIRNELFAQDSCSVISLSDIKNYFPPGTLFEDYWPYKAANSQLLIKGKVQPKMGQWTRQPSTPPINVRPASSPKPANQIRTMAAPYPAPQMRATRSNVRPPEPSSASTSRQTRSSYYINVSQPAPPPPLVRGTQTSAMTYTNAQTTPTSVSSYMMLGDSSLGYHQTNPQISKYPPPLIPVRNHYPSSDVDPNMAAAGNNQMMNQRLAHQQVQQQQQPSRVTPAAQQQTNDRMTLNSLTRKLIPIADPPTSGTHIPYKIQKALVEGKMIPCINMKPYVYAELLVTLNDLIAFFFNNVPINSCHQVMQVLGISLYKGNNSQMRVLLENGKCQNINEVVPMVQVRDVIDFMPQLKYMLGGQISLEVVGS